MKATGKTAGSLSHLLLALGPALSKMGWEPPLLSLYTLFVIVIIMIIMLCAHTWFHSNIQSVISLEDSFCA